jgi:hypothetical protein
VELLPVPTGGTGETGGAPTGHAAHISTVESAKILVRSPVRKQHVAIEIPEEE